MEKDLTASFVTEMRRGSLTLLVLSALHTPHYGYDLLEVLQEIGVEIEANTLYPLLRRLEKQGLLDSSWDTSESRPRKYYQINSAGTEIYRLLLIESDKLQQSIKRVQRRNKEERP